MSFCLALYKASIKIRQILSIVAFCTYKRKNMQDILCGCQKSEIAPLSSNILGKVFEVLCLALLILNKEPLLVFGDPAWAPLDERGCLDG